MGIFDFLKNMGRDVDGETAQSITDDLNSKLPNLIEDLSVTFEDGTVTLSGEASSAEVREKAILLAGNVKGVEKVKDGHLTVAEAEDEEAPEPTFYTVQRGDSLSKIAKAHYGDAGKWNEVFAANRGIIDDPDLIHPGQQIRIPDLS
ncbi:MAG: peptidoglycan-binding protein LysM [Bacteroidetes bacterium]|jgi:nucleoid-associated protein YgaU|nr:peptidoglycan-binding protein LysM [Bacteroidota bacterium]